MNILSQFLSHKLNKFTDFRQNETHFGVDLLGQNDGSEILYHPQNVYVNTIYLKLN